MKQGVTTKPNNYEDTAKAMEVILRIAKRSNLTQYEKTCANVMEDCITNNMEEEDDTK